jgi:hypothetical protein
MVVTVVGSGSHKWWKVVVTVVGSGSHKWWKVVVIVVGSKWKAEVGRGMIYCKQSVGG